MEVAAVTCLCGFSWVQHCIREGGDRLACPANQVEARENERQNGQWGARA